MKNFLNYLGGEKLSVNLEILIPYDRILESPEDVFDLVDILVREIRLSGSIVPAFPGIGSMWSVM